MTVMNYFCKKQTIEQRSSIKRKLRERKTLKNSQAVYFLYSKVPDDTSAFILLAYETDRRKFYQSLITISFTVKQEKPALALI